MAMLQVLLCLCALLLQPSIAQVPENRRPFFDPGEYFGVRVTEGAIVDTHVVTVTATDLENDPINYIIQDGSEGFRDFKVELTTGRVLVKSNGTLDRESQASYRVTVNAFDVISPPRQPGDYISVTFDVSIADINDEAPQFLSPMRNLSVGEEVTDGFLLTTYFAEDRDSGAGRYFRFHIEDTTVPFSIGQDSGRLTVSGPLDYDEPPTVYSFAIFATDYGTPAQSNEIFVTIYINDYDDLPPKFTMDRYYQTLRENDTIGTLVHVVSAYDQDRQLNYPIMYGIQSVALENDTILDTNLFSINSTTGEVITNHGLNYETVAKYIITVQATEVSSTGRSSTAVIELTIADLNDNFPVFVQAKYTMNVTENTRVTESILTVTAVDIDGELHNSFEYSIMEAAAREFFSIDPSTGVITLIKALDFEAAETHAFTVFATETVGLGTKNGTTDVELSIVNENDEAPMFSRPSYTAAIPENSAAGAAVFVLTSSDRDKPPYNERTYQFAANSTDTDRFEVDTYTGEVRVNNASFPNGPMLDYDGEDNTFTLTLEVTDGVQTNLAALIVNLEPVNDNPPFILGNLNQSADAIEGDVGLAVHLLSAQDADSNDAHSTLTWCITGGNEEGKFGLQSSVGDMVTLTTVSALDYEARTEYDLTIYVTDGENCSTSADDGFFNDEVRVRVTVLDVNDRRPVFSSDNYMFSIDETDIIGAPVGGVNASDMDSDAILTYSINSDLFTIDNVTGLITTGQMIDREMLSNNPIIFIVEVEDRHPSSDLVQLATSMVTVMVNDVNDNKPRFSQPEGYSVTFEENVIGSTFSFTVSDADMGMNGDITFDIISGDPGKQFSLNANASGEVTLEYERFLDRENYTHYNLTVQATDNGSPNMSTTAIIYIIVSDVNDNGPMFTADFSTTIPEDASPGSVVNTVNATDLDEGVNAELSYFFSVTVDNVENLEPRTEVFRIDERSGEIQTTNILDRETQAKYDLTVVVTDGGTSRRSGTTTVTVCVTDVNDNGPMFVVPTVARSFDEDFEVGLELFRVSTTDGDNIGTASDGCPSEGINSTVMYTLVYTGMNYSHLFEVNKTTGSVSLISRFDYDTQQDLYLFSVQATDRNGMEPALSSQATVVISVLPVNDNPPVFENETYTVRIKENTAIGTTSPLVLATDADVGGQDGVVRYSSSITDPLEIDTRSGDLRITGQLDFEGPNKTIQFTAVAYNPGSPELNDTATVTVVVLDVNDEAPVFRNTPYATTLNEGNYSTEMAVGLQASADDADGLANSAITFSLADDLGGLFRIDNMTGTIYARGFFDAESDTTQYTLTVVATDSGTPAMSTTATATISIMDVNDNSPVLVQSQYSFELRENDNQTQDLFTVSATDADINKNTNGRLMYELSGDIMNAFKVNDTTGVVTYLGTVTFDLEELTASSGTTDTYTFEVIVSDGGANRMMSTATVSITILDDNDNKPMFEMANYGTLSLPENTPLTSAIRMVSATDMDQGENGQVTYELVTDFGFFAVDRNSGEVTLTQSLDYESQSLSYMLTFVAKDLGTPQLSDMATLNVTVTNVLDTAPIFSDSMYAGSLPEDAENGDPVLTVNVTGTDNSGVLNITLMGDGSDRFKVNNDGVIASDGEFDYEAGDRVFTFQVVASYTQSLANTASVTVTITDVNDHAPVFRVQPQYRAQITAGSATGTTIFSILATDEDSGSNAAITYSFAPNVSSDVRELFSLDNETGIMQITSNIVYDPDDFMILFYVVATDGGDPTMSAVTEVLVIVTDDNTNAPTFNQTEYTASIAESALPGADVLQVFATDPENNPITYQLTSGSSSATYFRFDGNTIKTNALLDREAIATHTFTVLAVDNGQPPKMGFALVTITVLDVNDNPPVFEQTPITFELTENPLINQSVGVVSASDRDILENAEIVYTGSTVNFMVDPNSGQIRVVDPDGLDREMSPAFSLMITASDGGVPGMTASTIVTITLRDVNDETPMFVGAPYTGMIMEGSPPDNFVVAVSATDPDLGDAIVFAIEEGDDPVDPKFRIDSQGRILTSSATNRLDREDVSEYMLTVTATDMVGQKGTATVTVYIMDINDNPPEFTVGTTYTIHREETYTQNAVSITAISATDRDTGNNAELTYSVTSDSSGLFYFAAGTNDLFARCCVDRENPTYNAGEFGIYTIDVTATDGADNQTQRMSATLKLTINVSDYNDNPPMFPVSLYTASINETSPPNSDVITVMAEDLDFGVNSVVDYELTGSNLFRVDSSTGVVRVSGNVRFSETGIRLFNLSILARDRGSPAQFSTVDLTVHIIDENDNAPRFSQTLYLRSVSESSMSGTEVEVVMATDSDIDAVISYSLVDSFNKFGIDSMTGSLTLIDTLNREDVEIYNVLVVASDSPTDPQFATATVRVTVVDANDNAPSFAQSFYNATVLENSRGGVFVEEVSASDIDAGENGLIRYTLTGSGAENFVINENTGIVTVSNIASLDRETENSYVLTVTATDRGVDPQSTTVQITITLIDVNDNAPMFTQANYPLSISEDFYQGTDSETNFQVSATDLDGDMNLKYSITAGADNLFDIDSSSGRLIVIGELDRETKMTYDLVVTATDSGPVSFRGSATVTVTLTDVNDNAPVFTETVYRATITEASTDSSQFIIRVSASDADSGDNSVVRYSLADYPLLFDVNPDSGDVFTRNQEPFDRETRDSYTVTVVATDTGSPETRNTTATLVITVVDINDGTPYFDQSQYIVDMVVPFTGGVPFARLVANDDDSGVNAELDYHLSSNPHDFIMSDDTPGLIIANSNLSAALATSSYTLTISAIDRGSPRRTGTTTLLVNFLMSTDTRPLFDNCLFESSVTENTLETKAAAVKANHADPLSFRFFGFSLNNTVLSTTLVPPDLWTGSFHVVDYPFDREEREFYSLNVVAAPNASPPDGYAILFITIVDQNDNSPVFQNDPYIAEVTEGVAKGFDTGIVVIATDEDKDDFGTVSYSLTRNENSTFSINPTSGVLTVNNTVDRETNPTYDLIVEATDGGGNKVTAPITITVADINDNKPVFQGPFDRTINESFALVETVVTVVASDADAGINSRLTYAFDPSVDAELPFFIDSFTGAIRTGRELDFDSGETEYDITVIATDGGVVPQSASTSFRITITDVNDCTPTFAQPSYTVTIMENAQMGSFVENVIASDCDTGDNSNITYTIIGGDQTFRIVNGVIQVNGDLDYEQDQQFIFTVEARDNGVPSLSSSAEVTVFITDMNDNQPEFTNISLPVEISEATSPGSTIATVSATDIDSGDNARVNYYISEQRVDGVFAINDPSVGIIVLTQSLDRDEFSPDTSVHYWVVVRAEDLGTPQQTAFYNVTVQLMDINDNPPQLTNLSATCEPDAPSDTSVREGAEIGTFVYQVNATDIDAGLNAVLSYSITGGNTGGNTEDVFSISSDDGRVTVKTSPDRENDFGIINTYTLTIEVADTGNPRLTRTGCLKISVEDINDFAPAFSQESYSGSIIENQAMSTIVTVIATDRDKAGTPNADITFSWCAEAPVRFVMTSGGDNTINIENTAGLDCEEQSVYELCITAANVAGEPPLASNATITITCIDINDNRPMFNSTQCEAMLNETAPTQNTVVITLSAYDEDQPGSQNSDLVWLAPTNDNPFHLDASTGVITLQSPLDHEADPEYILIYTVRDSGIVPTSMSSTITCTFTIVDENDNPPQFTNSPFTAMVLEGTTSSRIATVTADDMDELPLYKDASFSIYGWSPDADVPNLFSVDSSTGVISLNSELDRETADQYTVGLRVTNTELGVCPNRIDKDCILYTNGSLIVTVSDANDNPPIFTEELYTADLPSSSNPGYNVKQVVAMDADDGINGQVTYSLQEPANIISGTFAIDSETGQITLTGSVQQYEGDTLKLEVFARDRNGEAPYNEAGANVSITVVGDIQRIALQYGCNQTHVNSFATDLRSTLERLTNLTIPYVVVTGDAGESTVTLFAQDPRTNLLVSFLQLEQLLFDNYLTIQDTVPDCVLLSIKSDIADAPTPTPPSVNELIPLFALCGVVAAGSIVVMILAGNQRRATRRQRKKDYLGNIFFGTATDVDGAGGLMQLEPVGATEEITHENPVFIDPFKKWENVDASREASHVAESAASLTRGNPVYESQEIRMEMFQEGADSELGGEDDELLAEALRDDSDDEDDILVTAI